MAARPMPNFVTAVSSPAAIQPRPVPTSGPDDDEPWALTPQNVADSLAVFGYAFAPTTDAQRAADPWRVWMSWPKGADGELTDEGWNRSGVVLTQHLRPVLEARANRAQIYLLKERAVREVREFCANASAKDIDDFLSWLDGNPKDPPIGTPDRLVNAAGRGWRMVSPSEHGWGMFPATTGEWRRALHAAKARSHSNPEPSNDIRVHAREAVEMECRRRLEGLPNTEKTKRTGRL